MIENGINRSFHTQVEKNGALTTVNVTNTVQYLARDDLRRLITVFDKKTAKYDGSTAPVYVKPLTPQLRSTKMVRFNPYLPKVQIRMNVNCAFLFLLRSVSIQEREKIFTLYIGMYFQISVILTRVGVRVRLNERV